MTKMRGGFGMTYVVGRGARYQADGEGIIENVEDRDVGDMVRSGCTIDHPETEKNVEPDPNFSPVSDQPLHQAGDILEK